MNNAINLRIFYARMNEDDKEGLLEITSDYPSDFTVSAVGPVYFPHGNGALDVPDMVDFTVELRALMVKYFGEIEPIWQKNEESEA
jgi:hypothetical protein